MFDMISTRFFILDDDSPYLEHIRKHKLSVKLYAELIEKFCAENNITIESHKFRCDDRLSIKMSDEEKERLSNKYGKNFRFINYTLSPYWMEFINNLETKVKFIGYPQFKRYIPWKIDNYRESGFEYDNRVYVVIDGNGIENSEFPKWFHEITNEVFYRDREIARGTGKININYN